jgi:tetratricopeptide (TPR) repeat protein
MADCPPARCLERFLGEALNDPERRLIETHVESCSVCQETLHRLALSGPGLAPARLASALSEAIPPEPAGEAEAFFEQVKQRVLSTGSDERRESRPGTNQGAGLPEVPGYEILGELGRGAVGVVYRARHRELNRLVALKMILAGPHLSPEARRRFKLEGQAIARMKHPNIVQVYEVGEQAGCPYLCLELVEGENLAVRLAGMPQPAAEAARILTILAGAVDYAHRQGVIHRDLKPANVLLANEGIVKITDFGLAKLLPLPGAAENRMTESGMILGTPAYIAPEQARGQVREIGPAADIYSLGAILYELLTGRPPFQGPSPMETLLQAAHQEPVSPSRLNPQVPRDLETICLKCLSKEPRRRYASAAALADDLTRFREGRPIQARPLGWGERSWRWARRNPTAAALLATALALVGLASGGGVWLVQQRARHDAEMRNDVGTAVAQAERLRKGFHFSEARKSLEQVRQRLEPAGPVDLRRQVEQARADLNLAESLDAARIKAATHAGGKDGLAVAEPLYVSAFAEAGLGREGDDSKAVSARVRDSALSVELIAALDDWASITADRRRREWLLAVASEADQNPARNRLRQPELWRDGARLTQIAQEPSGAEVSPQLAIALDRAAHQSGGDVTPLLTAVQTRYPQDFWINFVLGATLGEARRWDEALGYYRAALAVRPEVSAAQNNLGDVLYAKGRREEAIGHFKEALRLDPNSIVAHLSVGSALRIEGRLEEAIDHFQQALRLDPKLAVARVGLSAAISDATRAALRAAAGQDSEKGRLDESVRTRLRLQALVLLRAYLELAIRLQDSGERTGWSPASWQTDSALASVRDPAELAKLPAAEREQWQLLWADVAAQVAADPLGQGRAHAARRDWAQAADCYGRGLTRGPTDEGHVWFEYAALLLLSGDRPGYVKACSHLVDRCGKAGGPRDYLVARACTLAPDAVADASLPARLAEKELMGSAGTFWSLTEQGALAYRAGRIQEAVPFFEQSLQADPRAGRAVLNWLWLALAKQRLGKSEEARRWLNKAQTWLDQYRDEMPARAEEEFGLHYHNWLEAHVLRREAEALIESEAPRNATE